MNSTELYKNENDNANATMSMMAIFNAEDPYKALQNETNSDTVRFVRDRMAVLAGLEFDLPMRECIFNVTLSCAHCDFSGAVTPCPFGNGTTPCSFSDCFMDVPNADEKSFVIDIVSSAHEATDFLSIPMVGAK